MFPLQRYLLQINDLEEILTKLLILLIFIFFFQIIYNVNFILIYY
jgi:hypothetical protein